MVRDRQFCAHISSRSSIMTSQRADRMRIPPILLFVGLTLLSSGCNHFRHRFEPLHSSAQSAATPQDTVDGSSELVSESPVSNGDPAQAKQPSEGDEAHDNEGKPHVVSERVLKEDAADVEDNGEDEEDVDLLSDLEDRLSRPRKGAGQPFRACRRSQLSSIAPRSHSRRDHLSRFSRK